MGICTYVRSSYKVHMYAYMYNLRTCLQVLYAQFNTVKIGSLSYAEDDGKHVLGIKTPAADESQGYCCHVLECADEVCVPGTDMHTYIKHRFAPNFCGLKFSWITNFLFTKLSSQNARLVGNQLSVLGTNNFRNLGNFN